MKRFDGGTVSVRSLHVSSAGTGVLLSGRGPSAEDRFEDLCGGHARGLAETDDLRFLIVVDDDLVVLFDAVDAHRCLIIPDDGIDHLVGHELDVLGGVLVRDLDHETAFLALTVDHESDVRIVQEFLEFRSVIVLGRQGHDLVFEFVGNVEIYRIFPEYAPHAPVIPEALNRICWSVISLVTAKDPDLQFLNRAFTKIFKVIPTEGT